MSTANITVAAQKALHDLEDLQRQGTAGKELQKKVSPIIGRLSDIVQKNSDPMEDMTSDTGFAYSDKLSDIKQDMKKMDDKALLQETISTSRFIYADSKGDTEMLKIPVTYDDLDGDIQNIVHKAIIDEYGLGTKADILNMTIQQPSSSGGIEGFGIFAGIGDDNDDDDDSLTLKATIQLK